MSNAVQIKTAGPDLTQLEQVLLKGNLAELKPEERLQYYRAVCESLGLNPLTKPFDYITLNGRMVLYALKAATDQLRKVYNVSIRVTGREQLGDIYRVTAAAQLADGRVDEDTGAVNTASLKGEALANAYMKAETKAKRRVTLSICGLGMLDETEVEDIPPKNKTTNPIFAEQPGSNDGDQTPEKYGYRVQFGQWKGRSIENIAENFGFDKMRSYIDYIYSTAEKKNQPISPQVEEFIKHASDYIAAFENTPAEDWKAQQESGEKE